MKYNLYKRRILRYILDRSTCTVQITRYSPVPLTVLIRMGILLFKLAKIPWGEPFE